MRDTLVEFDSVKPGTVCFDTTDYLFVVFQKERSCYFVAFQTKYRTAKMLGGAVSTIINIRSKIADISVATDG